MAPRIWTNMKTMKLIKLMKKQPLLWNPNHSNYHDRHLRILSIEKIAAILHLDYVKVRRKWKSLRNKYVQEVKMQQETNSFSKQRKEWTYFKEMDFLQNQCDQLDQESLEDTNHENEDMSETSDNLKSISLLESTNQITSVKSDHLSHENTENEELNEFIIIIQNVLANLSSTRRRKCMLDLLQYMHTVMDGHWSEFALTN